MVALVDEDEVEPAADDEPKVIDAPLLDEDADAASELEAPELEAPRPVVLLLMLAVEVEPAPPPELEALLVDALPPIAWAVVEAVLEAAAPSEELPRPGAPLPHPSAKGRSREAESRIGRE